ncbi:MAG: TIGR00266 family protein [Candidatus Nanopusillus acidilobi]
MEYKIEGNSIQHIIINLNPGESVYVNPGHLIWKSSTVNVNAAVQGGIFSGISRKLTGSSFFVLKLTGPGMVDLTGYVPGKVVEINLNNYEIFVEYRGFLAAESSIKYNAALTRLGFGILAGEGLLMAKFSGIGKLFLHAPGDILQLNLNAGESIDVEAGHVLAYTAGTKVSFKRVGGIKAMFLGGEGLFFAHLEGPGFVWIKTLSRLQLIEGLMPELAGYR